MKIQTVRDGVYVMAGHSSDHKQGKLPKGVVLNSISSTIHDYELLPEHTKAVIETYDPERDSNYDRYPNFWIAKPDVAEYVALDPDPTPDPPPLPHDGSEVTDIEAAVALAVVLKWWKQ